MNKHAGLTRRGFVGATAALATTVSIPAAHAAMPAARALELAGGRRDELEALLADLVAVRSLSGESAAEAQSVVTRYLSSLPYRIEKSEDRPSRFADHPEYMPPNPPSDGPFVNVVGWPVKPATTQYAMFAHIDTHSIDDGWTSDPFAVRAEASKRYGLGVSDDKGGVAAMLVAAAVLAEAEEELPVVMSLHGKGGGSRGSLPVFDRLQKNASDIGAVLYVHPAETGRGLDDIKNEVQGIVDLQLTVSGWRAPPMEVGSVDSSSWEDGGNALDMCWQVLKVLRDTTFKDVSFNLGIMEGGDRVGSVADAATASFRLKFGGSDTWRDLLRQARESLADYAAGLPDTQSRFDFSLEPVGYRTNPGAADWEAPVSQVLRNAITEVKGHPPDAYPNHYAGDIRYPIRLLGVPAYGIGSLGGNFYGPNEWVDVDDLVRLVAVLVQTLSGWSDL